MEQLKEQLENTLKLVEEKVIEIVKDNGGLLVTDIHVTHGKTIHTYVSNEECITERYSILGVKINKNGGISILPFYEDCIRLSSIREDYREDRYEDAFNEWLEIHTDYWEDLHSGLVETDATLLSLAKNIHTHIKK